MIESRLFWFFFSFSAVVNCDISSNSIQGSRQVALRSMEIEWIGHA